MIKVSDYIFQRLKEHGITQAFMVAGGGAMHLNDSLGRSGINYTCCHHEQACAIAAEGYARASGKPAVVVVTSGPGGTNALTGVLGQWLDSVPCIYLSGQVRRTTMGAGKNGLRQLGDQEINIIDVVRPITKTASVILKVEDVPWLLDEAVYYAVYGRPGPTWMDIPLDIQSMLLDDEMQIPEYISLPRRIPVDQVLDLLKTSERPLLLAGHGIRIAGAKNDFLALAGQFGIPVVTSLNGMDLIPSDHPLYVGRIGTQGTYAGNYALQNCDLLISIGSRNNIRQVSYDWANFAPQAKKIVIDIDRAELGKPTVKPDLAIQADAGEFLKELQLRLEHIKLPDWSMWTLLCKEPRKEDYLRSSSANNDYGIDPYHFIDVLTGLLPEDSIIVSGNGTASVALFQSGIVKKNTRIIMNSGCAAMGYDLPAAIGAALAFNPQSEIRNLKSIICITGDGSIQMNIQELQTIRHHNLPIKIFVLNNNGYKSIRMTQDNYFEGRHVGADPASGVSCPDILKIAEAYDLASGYIYDGKFLKEAIQDMFSVSGPVLCEVKLTDNYTFNKSNLADFRR